VLFKVKGRFVGSETAFFIASKKDISIQDAHFAVKNRKAITPKQDF
jgi:hypothetical protein